MLGPYKGATSNEGTSTAETDKATRGGTIQVVGVDIGFADCTSTCDTRVQGHLKRARNGKRRGELRRESAKRVCAM